MKGDALDPKALIREAYRIEGISAGECRSIFMDWALSLPGDDGAANEAIPKLLMHYGTEAPDHPMTEVLREGMASLRPTGRRGGWRARRGL